MNENNYGIRREEENNVKEEEIKVITPEGFVLRFKSREEFQNYLDSSRE